MFRFRKPRTVVGLDIGSSAVKAIELKVSGKGKGITVAAFGSEPVPADSIVDGAIIDGGAVADAIRRLFEQVSFTTKEVAASLSGNAVIVKKITLPVMTDDELSKSIHWEAEQHIPFDIQDVNLDYQVLDGGPESNGAMDVLLVAAKRDKIADYTSVITQAGRVPVVVDVDSFALQNAFEANYDTETGAVTVLLNAGASTINLNIVCDGQSLFTRDISMGGNAYTEAVQKDLGLQSDAAERVKRGEQVDTVSFDDVRPALQGVTDTLLLEIQKTFDFFKATAPSERMDRILLAGGASLVDGFATSLEDRFGIPVEMFDPFRKIAFDPQALGLEHPEQLTSTAAVAVGLALRKAGDR